MYLLLMNVELLLNCLSLIKITHEGSSEQIKIRFSICRQLFFLEFMSCWCLGLAYNFIPRTTPLSGSCSVDGPGLLEKLKVEVSPKSFVATEICDGKSVIFFSHLVIVHLFCRT